MNIPSPSDMIEASKVAVSFVSEIGNNVPLILSAMIVSAFCALTFPDMHIRYYAVAASVFFVVYVIVLRHIQTFKNRSQIWNLKHSITKDERLILHRYLKEDRSICYFPIFYGASVSLIAKGILTYATAIFPSHHAPVAIQPYVLVYLRKHPGVIGLTKADIGSEPLADDAAGGKTTRFPEKKLETY
jgi:hypothetical protein